MVVANKERYGKMSKTSSFLVVGVAFVGTILPLSSVPGDEKAKTPTDKVDLAESPEESRAREEELAQWKPDH
jgi:hypothetical protein